ncbi:MAG: radical SAM family heme chaperone HemW [Clostridium sp.]|nr:radical SAM family heme chaperone HemW [Clostridium sp.]MCM1172199.1 radical SAM family heme chaperone HemW [Clostridium sp.]MCM1208108.1 radical SAM family heme chaperone HemW [Ruminococcus sp.]
MKKFLSLYIHIPFCAVKCKYCDFLSYDGESYGTMLRYVDCLCQEIKLYAPIADEYIVRSIFIGGGTPSLLDESLIVNIMAFIKKTFTLEKNVEVTIEANPGTLRHQKLNGYKQAGVNRISIGLQSADDSMLKRLGRLHNYDQFVASYKAARRAGFDNINIDVMSGLPGQSIHSYVDTLSKVIEYGPEHISAYSLSIEEGTPFANDASILDTLPPEMIERRMYEITKKLLSANGYDRYEISNYAKPGYECRHNMVYWTGGEYVGFGLGASSYFQGKRFSNLRDIFKYLNLMEDLSDRFVETDNLETLYNETTRILRENVTPIYIDSRMEEFMFLGLRMMCGVSREDFAERFKKDIYEVYAPVLNKYIDEGYMATDGDRIYLTDMGIDVSNVILADFLLDK